MPERPALAPWQAWFAWTAAAVFFFYAFVLRVSPGVMVGELMAEFQVGGAVFGTLSSLYFYTYAPLQLPAGMLMDRYGARRLITAAVALAALGAAFFAVAPTLETAYLARLLIGFGSGFSFVGALTVSTQLFPPARFAMMAGLLQGAPQLWAVAGDLFVKNMDWPGAQEISQRLAKTIDPKLLSNDDDPALQAANQQMQAMAQEMEQMHQMLQNVSKSMEAQEIQVKQFDSQVKAYDAETKRISAVQAGMSPEQIQDVVMGTLHGMITSGDLVTEMPGRDADMMPQEQMQGMPQEGMEQMPPEMMQQQGMPPEMPQIGAPQ